MRTAVVILLLWVLAACTHRPPGDCGKPIAFPGVVGDVRIVLLGEIHGTTEIPQFAGDLVCVISKRGQPVALALEISSREQPRIDAYLSSRGGADARNALVNSVFWRKTLDGRATVAMAGLIERVRIMRATGSEVKVVAIDVDWSKGITPGTRDETMAANVEAAVDSVGTHGTVIVLAGNIHTTRVEKHPFAGFTPMGYLLSTQSVIAFDARHAGGTSSIYGAPAEGKYFTPSPEVKNAGENTISLFAKPDSLGYSGTYYVGRISGSPHVADARLGLGVSVINGEQAAAKLDRQRTAR